MPDSPRIDQLLVEPLRVEPLRTDPIHIVFERYICKLLGSIPTGHSSMSVNQICSICFESMQSGDRILFNNTEIPVLLSCNHVFGRDCIMHWLREHQTCPMCRGRPQTFRSSQDATFDWWLSTRSRLFQELTWKLVHLSPESKRELVAIRRIRSFFKRVTLIDEVPSDVITYAFAAMTSYPNSVLGTSWIEWLDGFKDANQETIPKIARINNQKAENELKIRISGSLEDEAHLRNLIKVVNWDVNWKAGDDMIPF